MKAIESTARVQGLDLIRFFAISYVILLHAADTVTSINPVIFQFFKTGWVGVDLFFVLSGYLIGCQVFNGKEEAGFFHLRRFWAKRWWRTFPLYFVALFVYTFVKPLLGFPFQDSILKFFFFFQNFGRIYDFTQSWSLCIEEHFYIVFPILVFLLGFKKRQAWCWLGFVLLSLLLRLYVKETQGIEPHAVGIDFSIRFLTLFHLDGIACGVFLAQTRHTWKNFSKLWRRCGGLLGTILVLYFSYTTPYILPGYSVVWMFTLLAMCFSLILVAFYDLKIPQLLYWPIQKIALWSYGIYLWNGLLIRLFYQFKLSGRIDDYLVVLLFYLVSVVVAIPSYYLVEVPFLKWRDRYLSLN